MMWIFLEALVALALAVGIVWWTMGPKKKRRAPADGAGKTSDAADGADRKDDDGAPR